MLMLKSSLPRLRPQVGAFICVIVLTVAAVPSTSRADDAALTFDKVVEYLDLDVKEDKILKMIEKSSTVFTLGEEQVKTLKSKGASDRLIAAIQKKSGSTGKLDATASDISDFVLILDCSGSMRDKTADGKSKFAVAKQAALDLIAAVPDGKQLAFVAYGHNRARECQAVEVMRPLSPISDKSRAKLSKVVKGLQPIGNTPIALALQKTAEELQGSTGMSKIVLITDGMETCGGDPAKEAKTLAANERLKGGVNVIGFDLNEKESAAVSEIARAGNGQFYAAKNAAALVESVKVVAREIEQTQEPAAQEPEQQSKFAQCDCKPTTDILDPAHMKLGCYVKGRLPEGSTNFFDIELPAGDYVAVVDGKYVAGNHLNILRCEIDGKRVFEANIIFDPLVRGANKFHTDGGHLKVSLSAFQNGQDYTFGIFRENEVPPPYLVVNASYKFVPYELGKNVKLQLGRVDDFGKRDAFFRVKLAPGDYTINYQFVNSKGQGDAGAWISEANEWGAVITDLGNVLTNGTAAGTYKGKFTVNETKEYTVRVHSWKDSAIRGNFSMSKMGE